MTGIAFSSLCYEGAQGQVNWRGLQPGDDDAFDAFLCSEVEARLHDREGADDFEAHLRGLANTGFKRDSLGAILAAEVPEERDWAIGEAMLEPEIMRVVFKDAGFPDDVVKTNTVQILRQAGIDDVKSL